MAILLMRHGDAGEAGPHWPDDRLRPLTGAGRKESRRAGELLASLDWRPARALASPYLRTRETAEEFLAAFKKPPRLESEPALQPGGRLSAVLEIIRANAADELLFLCGHQPDMGGLADELGHALDFKKGALALLQPRSSGRQMKLLLYVEPRAWR
jgi:phosphohistidine phosphatase